MHGITRLNCCGVRELYGITGYQKRYLNTVIRRLVTENVIGTERLYCGALVFTQAAGISKVSYGERLAKNIADNNLGTVTKLEPFKNPNTGNNITTFLWVLDYKGILKYMKENNISFTRVQEYW